MLMLTTMEKTMSKLRDLFLLSFILLMMGACSNGSGFVPSNEVPGSITTQASEEASTLEIRLQGSGTSLNEINGQIGDVIFLRAFLDGQDITDQAAWFSSHQLIMRFLARGELHLLTTSGTSDTTIRVNFNGTETTLAVSISEAGIPCENNPFNPATYDPFMDEVTDFQAGEFSGFGAGGFPDIVLGAPLGAGLISGSFDVLSLGLGGEITFFKEAGIYNGPGADFIVFENAFFIGANPANPFVDLAQVSVSQDGENFVSFFCDQDNLAELYPGCAGVMPVLANAETNDIDPTDPMAAGGDAFDLSDLANPPTCIHYIRIQDLGEIGGGVNGGADIDAVVAIPLED